MIQKRGLLSFHPAILSLFPVVLLLSLLSSSRKGDYLVLSTIPTTPERVEYCNKNYHDKMKTHSLLLGLQILHNFSHPIDVLDVGANIGYFFVPSFACFKYGHSVLGVEPVSSNLNTIVGHLINISAPIGSRRCSVVRGVMGDKNERTLIHVPGNRSDNAALSRESTIVNIAVPMSDVFNESVPVIQGDDLLSKHQFEPSLIKVDVQGSEIKVFRGMREYLSKNRDIIIVAEQDNRLMKASGYEPAVVYKFLKELNFRAFCNPVITVKRRRPFVKDGYEVQSALEFQERAPCGDIVYHKQKKTLFGL